MSGPFGHILEFFALCPDRAGIASKVHHFTCLFHGSKALRANVHYGALFKGISPKREDAA